MARPEHPRPDLRRDDWINLNTTWDFAEDPDNIGLDEGWQGGELPAPRPIQLPYAWEAPLSGLVEPYDGAWSVAHTMAAETWRGVGWYHLRLPGPLPDLGDGAWHLVVGAADYDATAWADGQQIASHLGGCSPFSGPLPDGARDLVLRVADLTELNDRAQPVGKQGGTWYTRTSGVWQTVYLEWRPERYLASFRIVPGDDEVTLTPQLSDDEAATITLTATLDGEPAGSAQATVHSGEPVTLPLDTVRDMVDLAREVDPTRPVEDNSAGSIVGGAAQDGAPWWCSEFAGFSTVGGAGEREQYCELFPILSELRRQPRLTGVVLTQLTDVEYELNGLVLYDRQPRDLCDEAGVSLADLLGEDFVGFESVDDGAASLFVSTWGQPRDVVVSLSWDDGPAFTQRATTTVAYQTVPIDFATLPLPDQVGEHWLVATLLDPNGTRLAANLIAMDTSR